MPTNKKESLTQVKNQALTIQRIVCEGSD
jgi:hypothetical protein